MGTCKRILAISIAQNHICTYFFIYLFINLLGNYDWTTQDCCQVETSANFLFLKVVCVSIHTFLHLAAERNYSFLLFPEISTISTEFLTAIYKASLFN